LLGLREGPRSGQPSKRRPAQPKCATPASEGWSGKRDSNPRLRPWQGRTLPLSYSRSPSAWSFVSTSGGDRRRALRPAPSTSTPRRSIAVHERRAPRWRAPSSCGRARARCRSSARAAHVADERVLVHQPAQPGPSGARPTSAALATSESAAGRSSPAPRRTTRVAAERAGVRPGRPRHHLGARRRHAERQPEAIPFAVTMSGSRRSARSRTSSPSGPCPTAPRRTMSSMPCFASSARAAAGGNAGGGTT
jgi:hypothetical protein